MLIANVKFSKKMILSAIVVIICLVLGVMLWWYDNFLVTSMVSAPNGSTNSSNEISNKKEESYIKWFEFNVPNEVLQKTANLDISSHKNEESIKYNWIELISYLACKYGNDFNRWRSKDLDALVEKLNAGKSMQEITKDMKNYNYYYEGYEAVLSQFLGEYELGKTSDTGETTFTKNYNIKAFHPIAENYSYSHYDDFGTSRSYGYKRLHFGNDLMGSIGTPIIAVESGYVEALGWNQYGGWRIGIRSFDKKRYYYYAHLRKGHPYASDIYEGKIIKAGDVIGYLGMTGYSAKEDVNNINIPHLHFGIQLIFNEVQKDGPNQIWVDVYHLIDFLKKHRCTTIQSSTNSKEYVRKYQFIDPIIPNE